jgi:uncharacterized protein YdhG (YjbR/CyaY superfamily)
VPSKTFDDALANATPAQKAALDTLRSQIAKLVPDAVEGVNYGIAVFQVGGMSLVGLAAAKTHCSFVMMTGHTVDQFKDDIKGFDSSKSLIRFTPEKPLPVALVKKIVKARLAEVTGAAAKAKPTKSKEKESRTDPAVTAYLDALKHPLKPELEALRQLILSVSPSVHEGIKWNSPSFRTTEWFATVNVHGKNRLRLILHTGAKVKTATKDGFAIPDPKGLLQWLAPDRAMVAFGRADDFDSKAKALKAVLKAWVKAMPAS